MLHNIKNLVLTALILTLSLTATAFAASGPVVNINTADASELAYLPRVGPALSQRIVEFREENGKFASPEDLMLVRGIGERTFELMEPWVVTGGETTLDQKVSTSDAESRLEKPSGDDEKEGEQQ